MFGLHRTITILLQANPQNYDFNLGCWDVVGAEVMATIEEFRLGHGNMDRLNKAYIILLPKVEGAELHLPDYCEVASQPTSPGSPSDY